MNPHIFFLILLVLTFQFDRSFANKTEENNRIPKVLPIFQIVRFPNDPCDISGGSKNGTCYTAEECSSRGGTNGGTCASGFGVCCQFATGCGSSSNENCTYFEVSGAVDGACVGQICKCNDNICQIRLDFDAFVITGPSTDTISIGKALNGEVSDGATGTAYNFAGNCRTDIFTVSGDTEVPPLCGTLTGEHIYFDTTDECHDLTFSFGQNAQGATKESNRRFSVKASQISCTSDHKAPSGCLQWFTGAVGKTGTVQTFNFDNGLHLANQKQIICFRREQGNCRICFTADDANVDLSGKGTKVITPGSSCCGYGADGAKTGGYDCLLIPGPEKAIVPSPATHLALGMCQAGGGMGLASLVAGTASITICSQIQPFQIGFISDEFEISGVESTAAIATAGFKVTYYQTSC